MTRRLLLASAGCLLGLVAVFCVLARPWGRAPDSPPPSPAWFRDVTDSSGVSFVHDPGPLADFFMPQALGSGVAAFDCDGDGRLDLYFLHNGGPKGKKNQLFRQNPDGTFADSSA